VWHSEHFATSSTKYFPRLTWDWLVDEELDASCLEDCVEAITAPANKISVKAQKLEEVLI
jgi:hypothetical protein